MRVDEAWEESVASAVDGFVRFVSGTWIFVSDPPILDHDCSWAGEPKPVENGDVCDDGRHMSGRCNGFGIPVLRIGLRKCEFIEMEVDWTSQVVAGVVIGMKGT